MNNASDYNASRLEAARRTKDQIMRWACVVTAGSVAVLALVIAAIADERFLFGKPIRFGLFAVLCAIVLAGAAGLILLLSRRSTLKQVALELESQDAQKGCVISTVGRIRFRRAEAGQRLRAGNRRCPPPSGSEQVE